MELPACGPDGVRVVARGRYVEIATDRDEPVCGGTAAFIDAYVEAAASLLGESLPDRVFIRYEWRDVDRGLASRRGDQSLVIDRILPHEHELAHALHLELWPATRPFLYEGLAVLLGDSAHFENGEWPDTNSLDLLLEASAPDVAYWSAWFVVSQIVRDHGFDGLRTFWRAVTPDSSAQEIRNAYATIFDRPMEALFEPDLVEVPWMDTPVEEPRHACYFAVCVAPPEPWMDDVWSGSPPTACADDENAVGPTSGNALGGVWTPHTVEFGDGPHRYIATGLATAVSRSCALRCGRGDSNGAGGLGRGQVYDENASQPGRQRWDIGIDLDELPSDEPGEVQIIRLDP